MHHKFNPTIGPASDLSSPTYSTAYVVQDTAEVPSQGVENDASPFISQTSTIPLNSLSSGHYMSGNQLEYYKKYGYPSLPAAAGPQYLSQSPSMCEKLITKCAHRLDRKKVLNTPLLT